MLHLQYCYCSWVLGKLLHLVVAFSILVSLTRSSDSDEIDPVNMESKSDTSAQSQILDRELSNVESLVILFDQRYLVWKVAAKASWKQLEQYCTEHTLRNILSTNEDGRLEVIQAFDVLRQTSVPQQET